ncbi:MAG TPA: hypothetical protein VLE74_00840, partial [Candidatus Saccharimonadales bacterium]|nr:hypothetical protein [Candidatus Saccharimonadales bacterium]
MATAASREAMDMAGMATHDLASLHLATTSPDYPTPSTASIAHGNLGAPEACAAVEIRAACAGFIMGMVAASNGLRMQPEDGSTALVVGTELTSRRVNPHDRRSAILFGDGAGAVVLRMQPGASRPASASLVHPDREAVYTPAGGCAQPVDGPDDMKGRLVMDGPAVKKHALDIMTCVSRMSAFKAGLLDGNGKIDWSQIDLFVPHQAN